MSDDRIKQTESVDPIDENYIPTWEESTPVGILDIPNKWELAKWARDKQKSEPIDENYIPTWEESTPVKSRIFSPTKNGWKLLRDAFSGNGPDAPLAFIEDPQIRANLSFETQKFENPELERKKWALAAYFAQMRRDEVQFCHANVDTLLEQYYGKKTTVDEAYHDIGVTLGAKSNENNFWERAGAAVIAGEGAIAESVFNSLGMLSKVFVLANASSGNPSFHQFNPGAGSLMQNSLQFNPFVGGLMPNFQQLNPNEETPFDAANKAEKAVRNIYKEHYGPVTEWAEEEMALPGDWATNSNSIADFCENFAIATINYLPQLAAQTGLMVGTRGVSALSTVYGINGYYKIKDDHPEMSEGEAVLYGVAVGLINGGLEKITLGIIDGKLTKEAAKKGIKKGIGSALKYFGWAGAKEGMEEGLEQTAENLLDITMGLRGDTAHWQSSDWKKEILSGVPESIVLGATTGIPLATEAYVTKRQIAASQDSMRAIVHNKVAELSKKENLSPEEIADLEKLKIVDDAGSTVDVERALQNIYEKEIIRLREERDSELTDEEQLEEEKKEGMENYLLRHNQLPHNPQETIDTANKLMEQFPDIDLDVVYSPEDLPADVQARIAEDDLDVSRVRAWVDDSNTVHLIASNVRPSEVARTLGHEIIGHKGLRTVFGENFDALLDQVYKDHFEEVSLLAQRYHRDIETTENQRYLTEEFLADCANAETKPSWWKEFLGFVRQQLRKILPNMRFTDADIESALSRSARAMRKRNKKAASEFTEADGSGVRFSIRNDAPPKNTMTGYKVFAVFKNKPGQLFPPMVANPGGASTPVGVWLNADAAPRAEDSKTGRMRVQAGGKGTNTGKQTLAYRPGWHLGEIPKADQFNRINPETQQKELFPENFVWAECEFAADVDYQHEAEGYGYNANGKFQHSLAGLPKIPANGFYKYRTNPDPATVPWFITGAMKVKRILSDAEVNAVLQQNGLPPMQRKGGEMNLADYGLNNEEIKFSVAPDIDTPAFKEWFKNSKVVDQDGKPLVVYHGTDRYGFTVFRDDSHFTADYDYAKRYANKGRKDTESGVYAVYLSIQNPFDIRNPDDRKIFTKYRQGHIPAETKTGAMDWAEYDYEDFREYLQENYPQKYDGIILDEGGDADNAHRGIAYVPFSPTQIKSATDNMGIYDPQNPDIRFSVGEVWTGSGADYNAPSLQYIGSGEGQQVYGWGLYGSSSREVAEWYAQKDAERKNGSETSGKRNLYRQTFWDGRVERLLDWDNQVPLNLIFDIQQQLIDGYENGSLGQTVNKKTKFTVANMLFNDLSGGEMYNLLKMGLGSAKEASEFLYSAGIDGITYVGDSSGARNYVAFNDQDIKVDEHIRFSIAPENENLIVMHNVTAAKLRKATKLGGLPVPSLAIVDAERSDFDNFGEISLIADKSLIDPKIKSNKVYNADIYSPRMPEVKNFYSDEDYAKAVRILKEYDGSESDREGFEPVDYVVDRHRKGMVTSDLLDNLPRNTYAVINWYCQEHGIETPKEWRQQSELRNSSDFRNWWETVGIPALGLDPEIKMYGGTTNSGRQRWLPLTLENVVAAMTKKVRSGEGFFYGIGNIRSMKAKQFKSIAEIQKQRGNIVDPETMKNLKEEVKQELEKLSEKMQEADLQDNWRFDTAEDCLMALAEGGRDNISYLHSRFGDNMDIFREMAAFLDKLVNMPTEYFEAKPQRAVGINEFRTAVVPEDLPADVRKILEDAGLEIYTYGKTPRKAALQMATMDNDLRFSLAEYSEADQKDIVKILKPFVGQYANKTPEEYSAYLKECGITIVPEDAWSFALEAVRENLQNARLKNEQRRNNWLYDNYQIYKEAVDFSGSHDFTIKPSFRFVGENFSGSWISPEFKKYSEKRSQGKKESDKVYKKYLTKRDNAIANADGIPSDELAQAIAQKTGEDATEVEQDIIDFFRDLKKKDFYKNYTAWKNDILLADKEAQKEAEEEFMKQEQARIEDEVLAVLESGQSITLEWIEENRKVYKELYKQIFSGKEAPYSPSKKDLEAINAAVMQEGANASIYAEAYKVAREKSWQDYMEKLSQLKTNIMSNKENAVKLQRDALEFAEKNIPKENRSEFIRNVVSLLEYSTSPSNRYPESRRMHEFRKLIDRITKRSAELRKQRGIDKIKDLLDSAKIKRNYKGIPVSILPSEQNRVDRIRQAIGMNLATVSNAVEFNNQKIMELEEQGRVDDYLLETYLEDNILLEMFGNLEARSANEVEEAEKILEGIIKGGKAKFNDKLLARKKEVELMRARAVDDITFGKNKYSDTEDGKKHFTSILKNENLGTLLRIVSGKSIQNFDNSIAGELYKKVEDSTQKEATNLRNLQENFDGALKDIANINNMLQKGKFFRMLSTVEEHTGVFIKKFSRQRKNSLGNFETEEGRREIIKKSIPVEDYEWHGKIQPGARSLLQKIDNGEIVTHWHDIVLNDIAIAFLRQQLADFDAGLEQSYEIFNNESEDAAFKKLVEEAKKEASLILFSSDLNENFEEVEIPLSQGAALQILLTWEQPHYQPNMKWNGWTEKSIEQLKNFIKPEVLHFGYWMRDEIAKNKAELDKKVYERYGAHLPLTENYFPASFRGGKVQNVQIDSALGRGAGSLSINPNFLIARKFHLKPVDLNGDAFSSYLMNQIEQGHFLAWSDTIRDLRSVYGSSTVQKAINTHLGNAVKENLIERISVLAQGGGKYSGDYAVKIFNKLFRHWIPAQIAINQSSIIKQVLGTAAYMNDVPVKKFVDYFTKSLNFSNRDYREFVKWAKETDYMKNRLAGGMDRDLSYLLNYTRDSKAYSPIADALINVSTIFTKKADAWSALHGGYAAYMYALEQARENGYSEKDAREFARRRWMRATDETQQSGYLKDQNYFQSNQGAYRYLTAFMSNPIQTMNLELQTLNEIRYGKDKKQAFKKLGRQVLVNHLVVPTLMQFTSDMVRNGFNVGEWWEDAEFEDYFLAWFLGSFEAMFLWGKFVKSAGDSILDLAFDRRIAWHDNFSAIPLLDDAIKDGRVIWNIIEDEELTAKDYADLVRSGGELGMVLGSFYAPAGALGAVAYALGAQGKRVIKWFSEE